MQNVVKLQYVSISVNDIKKNVMGGACGMYKSAHRVLLEKPERKRTTSYI
jgi:hypothetical protein